MGFLHGNLFGAQAHTITDNEITNYWRRNLWYETVALRYGKNPEELVSDILYTQAELTAISEIWTTIKTHVNESVTRFVLGDLDIENDWNNYLNDLERIGLPVFMDVAQIAYTRMRSSIN